MSHKIYKYSDITFNGYYFFHLLSHFIKENQLFSLVDFDKSLFLYLNYDKDEQKEMNIKNLDEYLELRKTLELGEKIIAKKQAFSSYFNKLDLFRNPLDASILISQRLRNRLIEENVTGIEIKESDIEFYLVGEV